MDLNIYKEMVQDSPVAYLHIKILEDKDGNIISYEVINYNKAYERIIKELEQSKLSTNITDRWKCYFARVKKDKKYTIEKYIQYSKGYYNIEAYYGGNNEFHFRLNKISTQQRQMSSALKNAPFMTWMKDRDGKYIASNQMHLDFLGTTLDEIVGKTSFDFTTKEKAQEINNIEEEIMKNNKLKIHQYESPTREGNFEVLKWPWTDKEETMVLGTIGIAVDISESVKIQSEIEKMKMDFFANLSHELRTPITLILSALQLIVVKLDSNRDREIIEFLRNYIEIIGQNGRRLLRLVNNLIDTTRLDAGCFDFNPQNSDIVSCVEDICTSVVSFVNTNNLEIIFDTEVEEKIISFDVDNMERIILNLISNAIKFNKPNGKIEVTISCDENIEISVKDTGIGMPEDKLETIFERFEQVKNNFKREREGSGIGLSLVKSLVKSLVEIHSGSIAVKSKLGEGSEFIITLPDVLVEDESIIPQKHLSGQNRMSVEFSDIYI